MKKRRAVSRSDKDKKRQLLIDSAAKLFRTSQYKNIKMIDIAQEAGVAKGTVFFYFKTKEELFLELTRQEFERFFKALNETLKQCILENKQRSLDELVTIIESSFESSGLMVRLSAISNVILEQNIDYNTAKAIKLSMRSNVNHSGQLIEACFPELPQKGGYTILMWMYILSIGLQHVSDPTEIVRQVIEQEHLPEFLPDFRSNFRAIALTLLSGITLKDKRLSVG